MGSVLAVTLAAGIGIAGSASAAPDAPTNPPAAAETPAQPATVQGILKVVHADSHDHGETLYYLRTPDRTYRLHSAKKPTLKPNTPVVVRGSVAGNSIQAESIEATGPAPVQGAALGAKKLLVIQVVWSGASLTASRATANNFVFGSDSRTVKSYYTETSYGQMTWDGDVTPTLTITNPNTCDLYLLAQRADAAASAAGYTLSNYAGRMINAPNLYCGAAGYGEVGGVYTWIQNGLHNLGDGYARLVPTHEVGHALGLWHSNGLECGSSTMTSTCLGSSTSKIEYGHSWDVMGNNWAGNPYNAVAWFSAKQMELLGWLSNRTRTVTASGTHTISPLEQASPSGPQSLQIDAGTRRYYVDFRQPIGQDAYLSNYPEATNGVHVSMRNDLPGSDSGPLAVDMNPTTATDYYDFFDAPLAVGRTFTDPSGTFSLRVDSVSSAGANVTITLESTTTQTLSVTKSGTGAGTVTSSPAGINCGSTCSASFSTDSSVTLTATPASGSTFGGWGGACTGTGGCTVTMSAAKSVSAVFNSSSTATTVQESALGVRLDGWTGGTDGFGTYRTASTGGHTISFPFTGTGVTWVSRMGPNQGIATVTIDGVNKGNYDLYAASAQTVSHAFSLGSTATNHRIVIKVTGTKSSASTGAAVALDAFQVGTATTQENGVKVRYNKWTGAAATAASGGQYRHAATAGATSTLAFSGTSVDWVTTTGPAYGKAQVYIDGVDKGVVDLYAATAKWQTVMTYGGLTAGNHTIQVRVLGTKNASATSTRVVVDAFIVR